MRVSYQGREWTVISTYAIDRRDGQPTMNWTNADTVHVVLQACEPRPHENPYLITTRYAIYGETQDAIC